MTAKDTAITVGLVGGVGYVGLRVVAGLFEGGIEASQISITSVRVDTIEVTPGGNAILDFDWHCVWAADVWKFYWGFFPYREKASYRPSWRLGLRPSGTAEEWVKGPSQKGIDRISEGETDTVMVSTQVPIGLAGGFLDAAIFCEDIDEPVRIIENAFEIIWTVADVVTTLGVSIIGPTEVFQGDTVQASYSFRNDEAMYDDFHIQLLTHVNGGYTEIGDEVVVWLQPGEEAILTLPGRISVGAPAGGVDMLIQGWCGLTGSRWGVLYEAENAWQIPVADVDFVATMYSFDLLNFTEFFPNSTLAVFGSSIAMSVAWQNNEATELYAWAEITITDGPGGVVWHPMVQQTSLPPGEVVSALFAWFTAPMPGSYHLHTRLWHMGGDIGVVEFDFNVS